MDVDFVVDEKRELFQYLQLNRSTYGTWNSDAMLFYAAKIHGGKTLPKLEEAGGMDDIYQMGADLLVDTDLNIKFLYRSKASTDRPTIQQLQQAIN